jgi:hypothetical protein
VTQAPAGPAGRPGQAAALGTAERPAAYLPGAGQARAGPVERFMDWLIRKLSWSRLAHPRVAIAVSGAGLLLGMIVGATAPNIETLQIKLPLSYLLPSLSHGHDDIAAMAMLYTGNILACLGLAGMLWAHSQGWRPNPRHLLLASAAVVAVMVSLTPVGSSDTASYAAYGQIAAEGGNPYTTGPLTWLLGHPGYRPYYHLVGALWKNQPSVYGPLATGVQWLAARIGGTDVDTTVWMLMILNGAVFIGIGWLLLKTSDDPVRATLFWAANPVLIQQLVSGGHLDTFVAAAAIGAIQVARRSSSFRGDLLIGLLIGVGCGFKATAALVGFGLAWPWLLRREWLRIARVAVVSLAVVAAQYSFYGLGALKPLFAGASLISLPSPWWAVQIAGELMGASKPAMVTVITFAWPVAMVVLACLAYRTISADQPREIVAPFALTFAWILAAPWVFPWYTALAWVALTQVPRNRMSRWLAIVTVILALSHSSGGTGMGHSVVNAILRHFGVPP